MEEGIRTPNEYGAWLRFATADVACSIAVGHRLMPSNPVAAEGSFRLAVLQLAAAAAVAIAPVVNAAPPTQSAPPVDTIEYRTGTFLVALRRDTQTLARLSPLSEPEFDFTPGGREAERQGDGYVHLGDLHLRLRSGRGGWLDLSSSKSRQPLRVLPTAGVELAAADMTATMGAGLPLSVERRWSHEGEALILRFVLLNTSAQTVDIGALGLPMVFDNIITDRSLEEAHAEASFVDPYIGRDAGYLQVTRLNGKGPALLVLPDGRSSPLEAYRPILEESAAPEGDLFTDRTPRKQTFEGFYDWMVATRGFVENEWKDAGEQWNEATSIRLAPGQSRTVGVRFVLSPSIREIEDVLVAQKRPVVIGIPGYVVPADLPATLFINSPAAIDGIEVHPAGSLKVEPERAVRGWQRYTVRGERWGRARLSISYADDRVQTVSYFVTKAATQAVADLGRFITTRQFYDDENDPFDRAPAILSYDRETDGIVTQESRAWIAGMSDEGGAGSWVAAMMKQLDNPTREEVEKLEQVVDETIVGKLQLACGKQAGGVRKSLFYYEPEQFPGYYDASIDWQSWTSWSKEEAKSLERSYNYPHVAAVHWVLYRLARNHQGLVKAHDWRWYLERAFLTAIAMVRDAPHYAQFGQMEGEVFLEILKDLEREKMTPQAEQLEALMNERTDHWRSLPYPYGSEMAWDSTGQPEVYAWLRYFGHDEEAAATREVILGYDPAIPHWGYNGNARRYWDFLYAGKLRRIERQIHHYGSALNAVPLFDAYRANPGDFHLLRVAYGGLMGAMTNIDEEGFGSAAFHAFPDAMRFDALSGDYGMGFFGHAYATATYLVNHPTFGWLGFGGAVAESGDRIRVEPRDSGQSRLFVAPVGLWITLHAGKIESAEYSSATGTVTVHLGPANAHTAAARLLFESTTDESPRYDLQGFALERGLYKIPLDSHSTAVVLSPRAWNRSGGAGPGVVETVTFRPRVVGVDSQAACPGDECAAGN